MGAIFASGKYGQRAYSRWRSSLDRAEGRSNSLTGEQLELAIQALARSHPEYVVTGDG